MNTNLKLQPTLRADGYELTMIDRPSYDYKVWKGNDLIGRISVKPETSKFVEVFNGITKSKVLYDIDIDTVDNTEDLPIDFLKRIIVATATIS